MQRAVDRARALAQNDRNDTIYTDGPLMHNEQMMGCLWKDGIREMDRPDKVAGHRLMIRAHGVSPARRKELQALQADVVDATCPDVARIQGAVRRYAHKGFHVIIFGDKGHPEVVGLKGYANGKGYVVKTPEEVVALPDDIGPVCIVSQSTQFPSDYARIAATVRERYPGAVVLDTICQATLERQQDVRELAARVDAFVVVGGAQSANTLRLVELARRFKPTMHIQTAEQIDPGRLKGVRTVGLTAGASTPAFLIDEVRDRLQRLA